MPAPSQLEREIEATRAELGSTLSELQDKLRPGAIAQRNRKTIEVAAIAVGALVALRILMALRRH